MFNRTTFQILFFFFQETKYGFTVILSPNLHIVSVTGILSPHDEHRSSSPGPVNCSGGFF
jgi:hypothetical protein